MRRERRNFDSTFKARIALEALREHKSINQLAAEHELHPNLISHWKKQLLEGSAELFKEGKRPHQKEDIKLTDRLYQQIGQLKVEVDWLKKKSEQFIR
jgi:transposase-like protein